MVGQLQCILFNIVRIFQKNSGITIQLYKITKVLRLQCYLHKIINMYLLNGNMIQSYVINKTEQSHIIYVKTSVKYLKNG